MKILHVYKDFDPPVRGGIERHVALMCRYQREWADVSALTCSRSRHTRTVERDGTRVREVGEWGRFQSAPIAPSFPFHLGRSDADLVVIHTPNPTAEIAWLARPPRNAKLVVRYHSDVVRQATAMRFYRPVLMQFLDKADIIVCASQIYADTSDTLVRFKDRYRVIPYGVVPEAFARPADERLESIRARYGGRFVFFSGRHRYYKGLEYLVESAAAVNAPVVIAGDGVERTRLERLAATGAGRTIFVGELDDTDLVAHLHACAVFAFPSIARSEAFGISILEAHACGTPVVATRLGTGVEFANLDGVTGLNVPPRDAGALAAALNRLLADEGERATMGRQAQERVFREFRAEDIARAEFDLYRELTN